MTGLDPATLTIIAGPDDHGVVRHALSIADAVRSPVIRLASFADIDLASERDVLSGEASVRRAVHLHFTDRLYGDNVAEGVVRFRRLRARVADPVVVTLHDVPFSDGTAHSVRRGVAYRDVLDLTDVAIVASRSERDRLLALRFDADVRVIPLPVVPANAVRPERRPARPTLRQGLQTIGVLGYVYPGKGHAEVIEAAALLDDAVRIVAIGRCSDGHGDMDRELRCLAEQRRTSFELTGFLDDDALASALADVDVPVVPAPRTSASASLQTWIAAGRRPLVAANDYTMEVAAMMPAAMVLYQPDEARILADQLSGALARPDETWAWQHHTHGAPSLDAVVEAHRSVYGAMPGIGVR